MKDIVIKARWIKKELAVWALCFLAAFIVNVYSIVKFQTKWLELFTSIHWVLLLSFIFYALLTALRLAIWFLAKVTNKKTG